MNGVPLTTLRTDDPPKKESTVYNPLCFPFAVSFHDFKNISITFKLRLELQKRRVRAHYTAHAIVTRKNERKSERKEKKKKERRRNETFESCERGEEGRRAG